MQYKQRINKPKNIKQDNAIKLFNRYIRAIGKNYNNNEAINKLCKVIKYVENNSINNRQNKRGLLIKTENRKKNRINSYFNEKNINYNRIKDILGIDKRYINLYHIDKDKLNTIRLKYIVNKIKATDLNLLEKVYICFDYAYFLGFKTELNKFLE